ncbi:MAG: ATP-binding protein [Clostridia bacterium]|nr:ATP-binding protein [Clostridia bacterium]
MKYVCTGQCLIGSCPFEECIRKDHANPARSPKKTTPMQITKPNLPLRTGMLRGDVGLAADIGTTTVVVGLFETNAGSVAAETSALNAQCALGADIISRIGRVQEDGEGIDELHTLIVSQLNDLTDQLLASVNMKPEDVKQGVITGNTVMLHILAGLSPASMGTAPHHVSSLLGKAVVGSLLGLKTPHTVYLPPSISAFVGSDITCGMVDLDFGDPSGAKMLVDIGTNGEIVLSVNGSIVATATAAGPAFEAVNIACGMPAFGGAIEKVSIVNGQVYCTTIGGLPPAGICGSGLIDAVAAFLRAGAIDETGAIVDTAANYCEPDGMPALMLADGIYLTQKDVREFQTAKAAIRAGIETLLEFFSLGAEELDVLYLAGGFGEHIVRGSAETVGLIPHVRNVQRCGNTALAGAVRMFHEESRLEALSLAGKTDCLNLSQSPFFQQRYVDCMIFD